MKKTGPTTPIIAPGPRPEPPTKPSKELTLLAAEAEERKAKLIEKLASIGREKVEVKETQVNVPEHPLEKCRRGALKKVLSFLFRD